MKNLWIFICRVRRLRAASAATARLIVPATRSDRFLKHNLLLLQRHSACLRIPDGREPLQESA
jgi:hypothetical protein